MNDQVEEVKSKSDIIGIIGERVELKKAGSKYKAPCPFHSEKTPSFVVSPEIQMYKCFGCGRAGDVFNFLEEFEGMDFPEALKYLAERAGVKLIPFRGQQKGVKERLFEINSLVAKFYRFVLTKHPSGKHALNYLTADRGLKFSTIEKFQLGFSPDQSFALRKFIIEKNKVSIKELEEAGIIYVKNGSPVDRFRGRVIFPLLDHRGNITGFAGRILPETEKRMPQGIHLAKYVNTPETSVYKKSKMLYGLSEVRADIKKEHSVIVVEGELDMISSWQAGIKNVVAIKGSALTDEQIDLLSRFAREIVLALDADFAGNEAARRAIIKADREGMSVKVCILGEFKDPDEIARQNPRLFLEKIKNAVSVWDFLVNSVFVKYKNLTGEEKASASRELMPILSSIDDKIVQAHYISAAARKLQVPIDAVIEQMRRVNTVLGKKEPAVEIMREKAKRGREEILEERLLAVILRTNPAELSEKEYDAIFVSPFPKRLRVEILKLPKDKRFNLQIFANTLPKELKETFDDLVLKDLEGVDGVEPNKLNQEMDLIKKEIKILRLKNKLSELKMDIEKLENSGNVKELKDKESEFTDLTKKLTEVEN